MILSRHVGSAKALGSSHCSSGHFSDYSLAFSRDKKEARELEQIRTARKQGTNNLSMQGSVHVIELRPTEGDLDAEEAELGEPWCSVAEEIASDPLQSLCEPRR